MGQTTTVVGGGSTVVIDSDDDDDVVAINPSQSQSTLPIPFNNPMVCLSKICIVLYIFFTFLTVFY